MKWQLQRIVVTDGGVYRPPPLAVEAAVVAIALLVIGVAFAMGRLGTANVLLDAVVLAVLVVVRALQYRRHGRLGAPSAASRRCSHRSAAMDRSNHDGFGA